MARIGYTVFDQRIFQNQNQRTNKNACYDLVLMISPNADSKLFWFRLSGFSLFNRSVSFFPDAPFISSIFFVLEIIGIILLSSGFVSISMGFSLSTILLFLNSSMVISPPKTSNCSRLGAIVIEPSLLYNFLRIMIILLHIILPRVMPYLSIA